jgi:ABC-type uncharacterized transport system ATPase component
MNLPEVHNYGKLNSIPTDPSGYVTKDGMWAAVPCGNKFVIIHNGQQVHTSNNYKTARSYIDKQLKLSKKNKKGPLDQFL